MNWKAGDVVTLKSGGPNMTVAWIETEHGVTVWCDWFDENQKHRDGFYPDQLQRVSEEKPASVG
jgi:uncharacterized protein YodC (DUF2158 family)